MQTGPGTRYWRERIAQPIALEHRPCHLHQYGLCKFNGAPIRYDLAWPHPMSYSCDHKVPRNAGGADTYTNADAAHHRCNCARHDDPLDEPHTETW